MNGDQLRDLRNYLDLTQQQLASMLGISHSYLSQLEHGHRPISSRIRMQLSRYLMAPDYIEARERFKSFFN